MNELVTSSVQCPYCWEVIDVLLDCSVNEQAYIEDCQVCCRPINFRTMLAEHLMMRKGQENMIDSSA